MILIPRNENMPGEETNVKPQCPTDEVLGSQASTDIYLR